MSLAARHPQLPIVQTKLHRPRVGGDLFCRKRLHDLLDRGREAPLTLVSAPAGYGKSMLVSQWADSLHVPCAWLSLDESDSDLGDFARYLLAAIRTVHPGACPETAALTEAHGPLAVPILGGFLVNEIELIREPFVLVLDDYQRIATTSEVHDLVRFILEHPPQRLNVVILTRSDPPIPVSVIRGGPHVVQVRLRDLQFTTEEIASFLVGFSGLEASDAALAKLREHTEGWLVGIRLVALYLRNYEDPDGFLRGLEGGIQRTQDYLLEEVLMRQDPAVRDCMVKASIFDRFNADILDAVCTSSAGGPCGREIVKHLQVENLFTIALDSRGEWFRYHHLFQELLREQLQRDTDAKEFANLNGRASQWFEDQGLITEAISFALKAGDEVRAAEIVERHHSAELEANRWYVVNRWLAMVPADVKATRLTSLFAETWVAYSQANWGRVAMLTERVGEWLGDQECPAELSAEWSFFRGYLQYWSGDAEGSLRSLEDASEKVLGSESFVESEVLIHLAVSQSMNGHHEQAVRDLQGRIRGVTNLDRHFIGHLNAALSFVHMLGGELFRARSEARRVFHLGTRGDFRMTAAWGIYLEGIADLHAGDLEAAARQLNRVAEVRHVLDTVAVVDAMAGLALAQKLLGRHDDVKSTLRLFDEFLQKVDDPRCHAVADSCRARLATAQDDRDSAIAWARSVPGTAEPAELFFWVEVPSITRARVLIAFGSEDDLEQAAASLVQIREVCEACHFVGQTIEAAVLQVVVLDRRGQEAESLRALQDALNLAKPEKWVRPFVEAGAVMSRMLQRLAERGGTDEFLQQLLVAADGAGESAPNAPAGVAPARGAATIHPLDALTNRELDVLELLARRLRNQEIADELCISAHTVNYHLKQIYQKLDVHGRRQAVDRAIEARILDLRPRP